MTFRHRLDTNGDSARIEKESDKLFIKLAKEKGKKLIRSTYDEDRKEHWDWRVIDQHSDHKVDIKGAKRIDKHGPVDDRLILIEFTGNTGRSGWLRGQAKYIAFLLKEGFYFVNRLELLLYSYGIVTWWAKPTPSPISGKSEYIVYQRSNNGNVDLVTYVPKEEIVDLSFRSWRL